MSSPVQADSPLPPATLTLEVKDHNSNNPPRPCCKKTQHITAIAGKSLAAFGLLGGGAYFMAPAVVTIAAGVAAGGLTAGCVHCINHVCNKSRIVDRTVSFATHIVFATPSFIAANMTTGYYAWDPIREFVYTPELVKWAGVTAVSTICLGGTLYTASRCMKCLCILRA